MGSRTWIKVHCDKWLEGTLREEMPDIRGIWIDLLVMAGGGPHGDTGEIKLTNGIGLTDKQIAEILNISPALWRRAKSRFIETDRIKLSSKGAISIVNWSKYQSEYRRQKPYRERKFESSTLELEIPLNNPPLENEIEMETESEKLHGEVTNKSYNEKLQPPETSSIERDVSTAPPLSLSPKAPKGKAKADGLTNGNTVLPGEGRATLESDLSALGSPSRGDTKLRLGAIK